MILLLLAQLVTVTVLSSQQCFEPCNVVIRLHVEVEKDNQKVELVVESEDSPFYRSSELDANEHTPPTVEITYKQVPAGTYTVSAKLWKHDGRTWVAGTDKRTFRVIGNGGGQ